MLRKLHGKSNGKFLIIDHVLITSFIALRIECVGWVGIMYGLGMGKIWACFRAYNIGLLYESLNRMHGGKIVEKWMN